MKNKKRLIFSMLLSILLIGLNPSPSQSAGCCIKDTSKTTPDPSNCQKNVSDMSACTGAKSDFLNGDADCSGGISKSYCDTGYDPIGCCVLDINKPSDSNCQSNKKKSKCTPSATRSFDITSGDCKTALGNAFDRQCKSSPKESTASGTIEFTNPLKFTTVKEAVNALLDNLLGIIAIISVVFIVIGGIMYMLSAGSEKTIDKAKATISAAVVGLAISLAAPTFLKEIQKILGGRTGTNADDWVNKAYTIKDIAVSVLNLLLSVVGILGIIGMIIGGVFYLTAYGDEDRLDKGKAILTASLIGIAVTLGALVLVRQVGSLLGVN